MSIAPDDPRLTAYALGELEAADRPEIEALLEADPEARAFVDDVRATARLLAEHLRQEATPGLDPEHHEAIESRLKPKASRKARARRRWAQLAVATPLLGLALALAIPSIRSILKARRDREPTSVALAAPAPQGPSVVYLEDGRSVVQAGSGSRGASTDLSASPSPVAGQRTRAGWGEAPGRLGQATGSPAPGLPSPETRVMPAPSGPSYAARARSPMSGRSLAPSIRDKAKEGDVADLGSTPSYSFSNLADRSGRAFNPSKPAAGETREAREPSRPGEPRRAEPEAEKLVRGVVADGRTIDELVDLRKKDLEDRARAEGEVFQAIVDNPFLAVTEHPTSTFSIDVDTASYASVRRFLNQNTLPPRDAVRVEELVNYFPYAYPAPRAGEPFSVTCEVARCPWDADHRLVRIGLKGREIAADKRPPSNLVFLIDVSGSMDEVDKLPLLKAGMKLLLDQLGENDRVAIVVYAAQEGVACDSTRCDRRAEILSTLEQLRPGGATNGERGILLAYDLAVKHFIDGGTNRVILATDGDFNVGVTEGPALDRLIEEKRRSNVFLSVLGFGQGNVKHDRLERLAALGNGQYAYIDSIREARKVLVEQMGGTLMAIAKDVKIQVEFDRERASSYRLIGYENRILQAPDFEDDKKDAGEIGAGHCVTALYEVVPPGQGAAVVGPLAQVRQSQLRSQAARGNNKLLEVRLRCKAPDGDVSRLFTCPADDDGRDFSAATADFRFASSVAGFGMLLRQSPYKGTLTWDGLLELAAGAIGADSGGYRSEFLGLIRKAREIQPR